ncbi:MAG: diguanylate cyclase, partial [Clostridia bacterium]|nr:diguanylate cyclase [Clostridia bacterium]
MNVKMVAEIAYNISLLLALCSLFVIFPYNPLKNNILRKMTTGLIVGIIGIGVMLNPFTLYEGLVFDARSIILVVSGMFFGLVPTIIGGISLIVFRIYEGGVGVIPGITVILFSVIIGLSWRYFRFSKVIIKKKQRVIEFYIIGVITHIAMLVAMLTLPWETAVLTLRNISIPVLVIYPAGTLLISLFLSYQIDMFDFNRRLSESENKYRAMF